MKVHVILLFSVLTALLLSGCGTEEEQQLNIQDDLAVAQQRAAAGNIQEARQWCDRAIAVAPQSISTYLYLPSGDHPEYQTAIADAGSGDNGVFTAVGDDASIILYMTQATKKFPTNELAFSVLSAAQGRMGDTAGQRATAGTLVTLLNTRLRTPGTMPSSDLLDTLAQAYWDSGDATDGAATYRRVIATFPSDSNAYNGLGYAYAVANDTAHLPEALTLATKALALARREKTTTLAGISDADYDKYIGAIQDTVGWVLYRQGDYKNALPNVQAGVDSNPRLAEGRYHLAMVYKALGNTSAVRAELHYAVLLDRGYADAERELATLPKAPTENPLS